MPKKKENLWLIPVGLVVVVSAHVTSVLIRERESK